MAKKKRTRSGSNRGGIIGVTAMVVCISIIFMVGMLSARQTLTAKTSQEEELKQQITSQKEYQDQLEEIQQNMRSDEYVEEQARKYGYLYEDESIIKPAQ